MWANGVWPQEPVSSVWRRIYLELNKTRHTKLWNIKWRPIQTPLHHHKSQKRNTEKRFCGTDTKNNLWNELPPFHSCVSLSQIHIEIPNPGLPSTLRGEMSSLPLTEVIWDAINLSRSPLLRFLILHLLGFELAHHCIARSKWITAI